MARVFFQEDSGMKSYREFKGFGKLSNGREIVRWGPDARTCAKRLIAAGAIKGTVIDRVARSFGRTPITIIDGGWRWTEEIRLEKERDDAYRWLAERRAIRVAEGTAEDSRPAILREME